MQLFKKKFYYYKNKVIPNNKIAFTQDPIKKGIKDFFVISIIVLLIIICISGCGFIIYQALNPPVIQEISRAVI